MTDTPGAAAQVEAEIVADHAASIFFDGDTTLDTDCVLCTRAATIGAFARYGPVDTDGWPTDDDQEETNDDR